MGTETSDQTTFHIRKLSNPILIKVSLSVRVLVISPHEEKYFLTDMSIWWRKMVSLIEEA
jgi:hypothetical protein